MKPTALAETAPARPLERPVAMIGLMGAGKTAIGRRLAARLGVPFVDADHEIEAAAGRTIAEIFEQYGEGAFRDGEAKVIARLLDRPPGVIATGGGAFMAEATRALIKQRAVSLWLRADLDVLVRRTTGRTHRPLLNTGDPRQVLDDLMARRYPVYAEADVIVDVTDESPDTTCRRVREALEAYLGHPLTDSAT
jgi:shikimate kinase